MRDDNGRMAAPPSADGVAEALEDYLEAAEAGTAPPREEFLARHPELAEQLDGCLAALRFIGRAADGPRPLAAGLTDVQPPEQAPGQLGDFRILREVGRGGMGVVYEAVQVSLGRRVALKVLPFAATMDPRQLQRFHNEARAAASLDHPHIVHVHAVGCERAVHFYAMQYIDGQTLAALIAQMRGAAGRPDAPEAEPTTDHVSGAASPGADTAPRAAASTERAPRDRAYFRRVAEWGAQAAEALDHAHALGIVHRDVKPANLLVGTSSPVAPGGRGAGGEGVHLWVTDFGLAHVQSDARLTMTGDLVGTLRYMSPEQALAQRVVIDHRTDVYSLGATLYELLTLEPAFSGTDRQELLRQIAFEEPVPPRRLNRAVPAELATVVQKAMEKNPAERYATAHELAEDLRRYLSDEPIRARPAGPVRRLRKWGRRHQAAVTAAVAALVVVLAVVAGTAGWWLRDRAVREATTEQAFNDALQDSEEFQVRRNLPVALERAQRAAAILAGGASTPALEQRVHERLRDLKLVRDLEDIRRQRFGEILEDILIHRFGNSTESHSEFMLRLVLRQTDQRYAQTFLAFGIDVLGAPPQASATCIQQSTVAVELAAALDDWAAVARRARPDHEARWQRLLAVARAADPDPERGAWRQAVGSRDARALKARLAAVRIDALPAATVMALAMALAPTDRTEKEALLRQAQRRYPADYAINSELADTLSEGRSAQHDEVIRFATAAAAIQPRSALAQLQLARALHDKGRMDDSIATCRRAIELKPELAPPYVSLGDALWHQGRLDEAIAACRTAIHLQTDYPRAYLILGLALKDKGWLDEAIAAYRRAIEIKPDSADGYNGLGFFLHSKGRLDEAIACYRTAIRLKKDFALAHDNLGSALAQRGRLDEAITEHREAIRLKKDFAGAHNNLGKALHHKGDVDGAIAEYRKAIALDPKLAMAHNNLGAALKAKGRLDEGIACYREAIRLKKDFAEAHNNLGNALAQRGRLHEAIDEYREAIRLQPDYAEAHYNLGIALYDKGRPDEAIDEYREAIRLKKDYADARHNLGNALSVKGRLDEAITEHREAIRLKKDFAMAHNSLGAALYAKGRLDEAMTEYRKAIELRPDYAEAHCNLGLVLQQKGEFAGALEQVRRGHELGRKTPGWRYPSAAWVKTAERFAELERKLPAFLKGEAKPADAPERLTLAQMCQTPDKQLYATAGRWYAEAFAAQPRLRDESSGPRYNAACAAALAGCGRGKDAAGLDGRERARLRRRALDWLRADLAAWGGLLEKKPDQARPVVSATLRHWLKDPDFAGVRGPAALAQLPEAERPAWQKLWADVADVLARSQRTAVPAKATAAK